MVKDILIVLLFGGGAGFLMFLPVWAEYKYYQKHPEETPPDVIMWP